MKSYRTFIIIFSCLFVLYAVFEFNRPKPVNWTVTLSKEDKNPYGAYVLFTQLRQIFSSSSIKSFREPAYNILSDTDQISNAYIILSPEIDNGKADLRRLLRFAEKGNYIFMSAFDMDEKLLDTLGLKTDRAFDLSDKDSASINFVNGALRSKQNYTFKKLTIDGYFSELNKKDSTVILGTNQKSQPNFVKIKCGKGAFFIHAAPLCFSNYFMLFKRNAEYVSKALSYLPPGIKNIYWDEYYKLGRDEPQTPLRFLLSNEYLLWALRITMFLLISFVLFDMKRRQRIIPVIEPLHNTSLDFVRTVSSVYYHEHDNKNIAEKKVQYWLEFIRRQYYLSAQTLNDEFADQLHKKSGASKDLIAGIINYSKEISAANKISDAALLNITQTIDSFYKTAQS